MKRFLSLALAMMMILSAVSFNAFAVNTPSDEVLAAAGADGLDEGTVVTIFENPVTTTFGAQANLIPADYVAVPATDEAEAVTGVYVAKTNGNRGFALILKVDGIEAGQTPVLGQINPTVTLVREGVEEPERKAPVWNANWVNDVYSTNSTILSEGNGYYLYWFPFKNIDNAWLDVYTETGVTTINQLNIFDKTGALGNGRAAQVLENANQTVTCVGVIEGSIAAYDVYAYDKGAQDYVSASSGVSLVGDSNSNNAQWVKVKTPSELFGSNFAADEGEALSGWVDRNGEAVSEFPLGVKIVEPVYETYNIEDVVTVTFVDDKGNEVASARALKGTGMLDDYPASLPKTGVLVYEFLSWSVDGVNPVDFTTYNYTGDITVKPLYKTYGTFFNDEPIPLTLDAGLSLLPAKVEMSANSHGVTVVYKVEGADTEIIADNLSIAMNGGNDPAWQFTNVGYAQNGLGPNALTLNNGYYYIYFNQNINGTNAKTPQSFDKFTINNATYSAANFPLPENPRTPENDNEDATFQMLAVVVDNLQPTVVFHGIDGEVLATEQYKYTDVHANLQYGTTNPNSCQSGELISAEELFAQSGLDIPVKESTVAKVTYEFDGWVDADGNKIEAVYNDVDAYPSFVESDNRTKYTVEFVNADDAKTVLQSEVVAEDVLPEYKGETPKLPSTDTKSYVFKGWDKEIVKTPVTDKYDGALVEEKIVYTATFEEVERRYDVSYYDEDGETKLGEVLNIVRGQAANFEVVPTKDADVQNTYTFEKWVAMDGSDVDLTRVEADLSVKAQYKATLNKYTVTFMSEDKSEQLATSTVDYGTAAQAPEVTKDPIPEKHIAYEFDAWVDAEGDAVDVTNVTGDVTVYATFKNVLTHEFTDLNEEAWYMPSVKYALQNGLMSGMNSTTFAPDATMTRAQFATVLYRMEGEPDVSEMDDPTLPDYNADAWWADAFKWANNVGIINGSNINGVDLLDPDGTVTRLQIATMLYRYADKVFKASNGSVGIDMKELDKIPPTSLADFQDKNLINYSTKEARWAYNHEYITGMTKVEEQKPYFAPSDGASRAQVITILMRFLEDTEHHNPKASA